MTGGAGAGGRRRGTYMNKDERQLENKKCIFTTNDNDWKKYSGQECIVLHGVNEKDYDIEDVGSMWVIKFADGVKTDAFAYELELSDT
jgi:hypothetical protein